LSFGLGHTILEPNPIRIRSPDPGGRLLPTAYLTHHGLTVSVGTFSPLCSAKRRAGFGPFSIAWLYEWYKCTRNSG